MPIQRRLPNGGFVLFQKSFAIIHIRDLNRFPKDTVVEPELPASVRLLRKRGGRLNCCPTVNWSTR